MTKPRIAVAGIHIESSTFTPYICLLYTSPSPRDCS